MAQVFYCLHYTTGELVSCSYVNLHNIYWKFKQYCEIAGVNVKAALFHILLDILLRHEEKKRTRCVHVSGLKTFLC